MIKDPMILLGYVNAKLRDEYSSLAVFCEKEEVSAEEIEKILGGAGFVYRAEENQFR